MNISVTIATFNRCDLLNKILEAFSLQDAPLESFEIIVCDSQSSDNTVQIIESWKSKLDIRCIQTDNVLAKKRNVGIENSNFDYVIFLDDDCFPDNEFISSYREIFKKNIGMKAVFCGNVIYPEAWVNGSNYYRFRNERHIASNESYKLDYKTIVVMNMGFNKKLFVDSVKGANENFIGYGCEDQELGWRLEMSGFEIMKSNAKITHYETTDSILGYMKKIHRSSRDGMKTLIEVCPDAAWNIKATKYVEPDFPYNNKLSSFVYKLLSRIVCNRYSKLLVVQFLLISDKNKRFYSPSLYRYALACAYLDGMRERNESLDIRKANKAGWY